MTATDEWWKSLRIEDKERIAGKIKGSTCQYPECTHVWLALDDSKKEWILSHCTQDHGVVIPDWTEGKVFSY